MIGDQAGLELLPQGVAGAGQAHAFDAPIVANLALEEVARFESGHDNRDVRRVGVQAGGERAHRHRLTGLEVLQRLGFGLRQVELGGARGEVAPDAANQVIGERDELSLRRRRLAPLGGGGRGHHTKPDSAAATTITQQTLGELRNDDAWRAILESAVTEACAIAAADGATLNEAAQWEILDTMPASVTTSTARDAAAGRPTELDAILGAVVRAGRRLDVDAPTLDGLLAEAEDACRAQSH